MKNTALTFILIALSVSAFSQNSTAQVKDGLSYFGLSFDAGIPLSEFKTINDNNIAFGGGLDYFYQPTKKIPLLIGLDFGFMNNGIKTENQTLTAYITVGTTVIDSLLFPLKTQTSNNIINGHIAFRFLAPTQYFKPYIDILGGLNYFYTSTSIFDESTQHYFSDADNNLIVTKMESSDVALSYGAAAGLLVQVGKQFFIDLRCSYTMGGVASYFTKNDIQNWDITFNTSSFASSDSITSNDIQVSGTPKTSHTNMIQAQAGITFTF